MKMIEKKSLPANQATGLTTILLALFFILPFSSAHADEHTDSYDNIKKDTRALMESVKKYSIEKKDELVLQSQTTLEKIDQSIEKMDREMEKNWDKLDSAARSKYKEEKRVLQKLRGDVAATYDSLKRSSTEAWDATRERFSQSMEKFFDAWKDTADEVDEAI